MKLAALFASGAVLLQPGCGTASDPFEDSSDAGAGSTGAGATGSGSGSASTTGAGGEGALPEPDPELDAFLEGQLEAANIPGMAAAVLRDGDVAWLGAYGLADVEQQIPVETTTLFQLASISKTVVGVAVMQLEEQGWLGLDDDLSTLLPFEVRHPGFPGTPITVRMLLTHTASIRDEWYTLDAGVVPGDSPVALGDFLEDYLVPGGELYSEWYNFTESEPGQTWEYSNVGAALAAYVVEAVSGEPFDAYCQTHLFGPLQMDESAWYIGDLDPSHVAMPYDNSGGTLEPYGQYGYPDYPDGSLRTSAPQLGRFLSAFIHDGSLDGAQVLEPATAQSMKEVQLPAIESTQALVWYYWGETLGHDGLYLGVRTSMFYRPSDGAGVIFLLNAVPDDRSYAAIEDRLWQKADALAAGD